MKRYEPSVLDWPERRGLFHARAARPRWAALAAALAAVALLSLLV